jgi:hypothetical protein
LRQVAIEDFELEPGETPYDIAVAIRAGALDGRHPEVEREARRRIAAALTSRGRLFIDGGDSIREIRIRLASALMHVVARSTDCRFRTLLPSSREGFSETGG